MKEDLIIKGRLIDLANKSYNENVYTFTRFLGLSEQSLFYQVKSEMLNVKSILFGGAEGCERQMVRFGDPKELGYEVEFPISVIKVVPRMEKYAQSLTHRDCLGALMNLGIQRDVLGDIIFGENEIFIFCKDSIAEFITESLFKIKHTDVDCSIYNGELIDIKPRYNIESIQISSPRIDAVVAKAFKLSRDNANSLFKSQRVYLNGKEMTGNATKLKENDIISVRGKGRIRFVGEQKITKKGNLVVTIHRFI